MHLTETMFMDDEDIVIQEQADVTDLVEQNKALHAESEKHTPYGEFTRVASIPLNIYFELKRKGVIDDPKALKAWLNDPDNRFFRTRAGKV